MTLSILMPTIDRRIVSPTSCPRYFFRSLMYPRMVVNCTLLFQYLSHGADKFVEHLHGRNHSPPPPNRTLFGHTSSTYPSHEFWCSILCKTVNWDEHGCWH